jgi:trehalose/maltose hydrolase-like predicted phosphorylase
VLFLKAPTKLSCFGTVSRASRYRAQIRSTPLKPISPPRARGSRGKDLPAYVSNGMIGLRVRENPFHAGMAIVAGLTGEHPERRIESIAAAPYPLAGDIALDGLWMSDFPTEVTLLDQAYDFETAELTSRFRYRAGEHQADVSVVTFASRTSPTLVLQETTINVGAACDVSWRASIDARDVRGRQLERRLGTPGEKEPACDGVVLWQTQGEHGRCGIALLTEVTPEAERSQSQWDRCGPLSTTYKIHLAKDRTMRCRQIVSLIPKVMHAEPDHQAVRLVADAKEKGFERLRADNRKVWNELWGSRIIIESNDGKWQALADAAFFYTMTSVHAASPASTSIYGLATWRDYHYYFGHVMWDVDAFAIPPLSVLQPDAARALLAFRSRSIEGARHNARLRARAGIQFPWEAGQSTGEEATPGGATAAMREDHINLHVARGFGWFADASGDPTFLREQTWPILCGVSDWLVDRVSKTRAGYEIKGVGGPAERKEMHDNDAMTLMAARVVLRRAQEAARQLGYDAPPTWAEVSDRLVLPVRADGAIADHDDYRKSEEKGATPGPLAGLFPYWFETDSNTEASTLRFYLDQWKGYVGSPMFSALYGVWAAWAGDRALALRMMEEGFARFQYGRFAQTLEYRLDTPKNEGVASGPFFANNAGFLTGLLFGLPGLKVSSAPPSEWPQRDIVLPQGWDAVRCERLCIRGETWSLSAPHGERRADLAQTS